MAADRVTFLEARVADLENEIAAVRSMPELVAQHERRLDRMREDALRADDQETRRMEAIYVRLDKVAAELATKVDAVDSNCRERFDTLDRNVKLLPNKVSGTNWPAFVTTLLAAATGVGAPIAAAILLGPGS